MIEDVLHDLSVATQFRSVSLRYFNAAGADPSSRLGECHSPESHLIPLILKTAKGERDYVRIYGTDYPTLDGSCIRDYVHVEDLVTAHLLALEYLLDGGKSEIFNCGYGNGHSVREVIEAVKKVTNIDIPIQESNRRAGDTPLLVADSSKLKQKLKWRPKYDDLNYIIQTAWDWEKTRK